MSRNLSPNFVSGLIQRNATSDQTFLNLLWRNGEGLEDCTVGEPGIPLGIFQLRVSLPVPVAPEAAEVIAIITTYGVML